LKQMEENEFTMSKVKNYGMTGTSKY